MVTKRLPVRPRNPGWAEIWWTEFDHANRRPGLVISRPEAALVLPRLLVVPATTNIRDLPTEVFLSLDDGVPKACVLNLDSAEMVSRHALVEYIATLSALRWHEVCAALETAVNCRS